MTSREGGALLGYNKYNNDSDETSSESEPEQPSVDEIDVSTHSFVSNGERVWRAPDDVFSKRSSSDLRAKSPRHRAAAEGDESNRNSGGAESNDSRRSSGGPEIPRLNFGSIVGHNDSSPPAKEQPELRASPGRLNCCSPVQQHAVAIVFDKNSDNCGGADPFEKK